MKLYRITADDGDAKHVVTEYVGTQAEGVAQRKKLKEDGFAQKHITTEDVEVPTDKAGLIDWLNKNAV